jgi:hypothetical protein
MNADAWSAVAAWAALGLGVINSVILLKNHPDISYRLDEKGVGGRNSLRFVLNADTRQLLVKSVRLFPHRGESQIFTADGQPTMFRDMHRWGSKHRFSALIPPGEKREIVVSFDENTLPCLLVMKWNNQRPQLLPFYVCLLSKKMFEQMRAAEPLIGKRL